MAAAVHVGGLEEDFVDKVKDTLICHICTSPLRDPHLTVCCGHNFCESCLEQWLTRQRRCPFCRSAGADFQHFPDKKTKREINVLKVRCSYREKGCEWVGELGALKNHLYSKDGCGYVELPCPYACEIFKTVMRKNMDHHLKVECKKRPYLCERCGEKGTFIQITGQHCRVCPNFLLECPNMCGATLIKRFAIDQHCKKCPLEVVTCPFKEVGCTATMRRKDEAEHMKTNVVNHQLLMLKSNQRAKEEWNKRAVVIAKNIDSLLVNCTSKQKLPLHSIRSVIDDSYCLKLEGASLSLQLTNFSKYKQAPHHVWYSPPFYLGDITGLKLRLAVYPNGIKEGACTHVSLVIECLKRDLEDPKEMECGSYVNVQVIGGNAEMDDFSSSTNDICRCKESHEIWADAATKGGFHCDYTFIPRTIISHILCPNDCLKLQVQLLENADFCDCLCHAIEY